MKLVDVTYAFPTDAKSRHQAKEENEAQGRQWVSTAIVEGRERMRFGRYEPDPHKPIYYVSPDYRNKLIPYAGKEEK